jgi:hypothetical protein
MTGSCITAVACAVLLSVCRAVVAAPDYWDPRLDQICQLELIDVASLVPEGQGYWRLCEARFQDEVESGGNHNIYVKCLRADGTGIENQKFFSAWPYGNTTVDENVCVGSNWACAYTKGSGFDDYWGNVAMWGGNCPPNNCGWPYSAFVSETSSPAGLVGPSDKVIGMGMHNPLGTPCNAHVNFLLIFKWTISPPKSPTISRSPASFIRSVVEGQNLPNDTFTVWNSGGGTLSYTVGDNAGWLSQTPFAGMATTETDTITIEYSVGGLAPGGYEATITISDPASTNKTATIAVSLIVEEVVIPGDFDNDKDVDQYDFGRFQACLSGPGNEQKDPLCAPAKLDPDTDVDKDDFAIFSACLTGQDMEGDPDCGLGI